MAWNPLDGNRTCILSDSMNPMLMPLAKTYGMGVQLRAHAYRRGWLKSRQLSRPVVSVGNLSVGGSGKTPLVAWIVAALLRHGYKPAILTRGYGRRRGADVIVLGPRAGRTASSRDVGDEPALLAQMAPQVPILICADRYRAGRLAEERFGVDVHVLDDGFQHFALHRDLDLVAVDVTQRLSDGALLPAGRLREPCSALKRSDLILLTRAEIQDAGPVEDQIRLINPRAKIFRSSTALQGLVEVANHRLAAPEVYAGQPMCAFCGIGNPRAFFTDLGRWGFTVGAQVAFRDHHVYGVTDVERLQAVARNSGATALLTTEKDLMNLPRDRKFELPVLACAIQLEISGAAAFEEGLLSKLSLARRERAPSAV